MRAGLLYCLFAIFTVLIVSSELKDKKQPLDNVSSCQLVGINKHHDCLIISINNSLQKPVPELLTFRLVHERLIRDAYEQKMKFSLANQRLQPYRFIELPDIEQVSCFYCYSIEEDDYHHLS